jgi:hypothetical protein
MSLPPPRARRCAASCQDGEWSLMCPNECPGLADVHSAAFVELYTK